MIKSKKQMFLTITIFTLIMILGTVSYAFFNYTRTGSSNNFRVGRMSFISRNEETITINDLFPIDPNTPGIMNDTTKVGTYEIDIVGDTDYSNGIEYLVSAVDVNNRVGSITVLPISIDVNVDGLGTQSDTYFTSRNSKDSTIYKRLSGDEVYTNQQLLVGYIKPNTESGTAEGVNGKITIKAYIDKDSVLITDTYETDFFDYGSENYWNNDRKILFTDNWNALQSRGISFKIKVEANNGIWVDDLIYNTLKSNAVMDNINSTYVNNQTPGIDFSNTSSDTNGKGLYIRSTTKNRAYPVMYYRGDINNNNVYFAGKCWQIVRTTDTGGTRLIYNGENTGTELVPACEPQTGADRQITLNVEGVDTNTFAFSGENLNYSIAYQGYTYSTPIYTSSNGNAEEGSMYGNDVVWNGTNYTLTDVSNIMDSTHHYTCATTGTTTCNTVRFYILNSNTFFTLSGGKTIGDVLDESLLNGPVESNAKIVVENWFENEINNSDDVDKIEDAIYCNDRSLLILGVKEDSTTERFAVIYSGIYRAVELRSPSIKCMYTRDSYTTSNATGNGLLNYPVGLINVDEVLMAGGIDTNNNSNLNYYLNTGKMYWTMSPRHYDFSAVMYMVYDNGILSGASPGFTQYLGIRPVISLKYENSIAAGDGTPTNPYIIK